MPAWSTDGHRVNNKRTRKMTDGNLPEHSSKSPDEAQCEDDAPSSSKRSLLRAAWVAPVVIALSLPRSSYAANVSGTHNAGKDKVNNGNHFGQLKKGP